jgi:acyl-CoA thioesterase I
MALADFVAQAIGASAPEKGYVGLLTDEIARKFDQRISNVNVSKSGATLQIL